MKPALRLNADLRSGPLAWMARNSVAANLLMFVFIVGGLAMLGNLQKSVMPEVELDAIAVSVVYPGASPAEVEEGIVLAIEEEMRGVDGVKKVTATAAEGVGRLTAELLLGADADRALSDVKAAVDRITSLPDDAERPVISLLTNREQVLNLVVSGPLSRQGLYELSESVRAELLADPRITLLETDGLPPPEISIEISQENLRRYGLTLQGVANRIAAASIELPGGSIKTEGGEILLRTTERRDAGGDFEDLVLIGASDGTRVRLGDIATIRDDFQDNDFQATFNGQSAATVQVFRVGKETPITVAQAVHEYVRNKSPQLPDGVSLDVIMDQSVLFEGRMNLLIDNGILGVLLVVLVLGIFLTPRLAFWVTLGLPISFLGAIFLLPALDVSINMISMFAFILTIGIVVDDAVVVGEATFKFRREGLAPMDAAIAGVREVLTPIIFAVLTTIMAFVPLMFVPGVMGKFFINIPLIVIPILLFSLIESMVILPAHLAHIPLEKDAHHFRFTAPLFKAQRAFSLRMERWIEDGIGPLIDKVVRRRYLTLCASTALLLVAIGVIAGGHLRFTFLPDVEADNVVGTIELPYGSPARQSQAIIGALSEAAWRIGAQVDEVDVAQARRGAGTIRSVYAEVGRGGLGWSTQSGAVNQSGSGGHVSNLNIELAPSGERRVAAGDVVRELRAVAATLPGIERSSFTASLLGAGGASIAVELTHRDTDVLNRAAARLAEALRGYTGVMDIDDGSARGKTQLDLELKPAARNLGLTERDLAVQIRSAFYGAEAVRQQRGRDELRVYVRLPANQRESQFYLDNLVVQTPAGGEVPLSQVATVTEGTSYTEIGRRDGRRIVTVTGDVDEAVVTGQQVIADLRENVFPELLESTPGLGLSLSGEQETQSESLVALGRGMVLALFGMYALIAIAFRSYLQPLAVMIAIPFGLIGAVAGHLVMGYSMSMISLMGLVALAGVVVNDSLVLITAINDYRRAGMTALQATISGATRRVRPVILTSLTTFFGLAPMIFETELQARFLIPMALSLGFGVLMVTGIALMLVPSAYLMIEDLKRLAGRDEADEPLAGAAASSRP